MHRNLMLRRNRSLHRDSGNQDLARNYRPPRRLRAGRPLPRSGAPQAYSQVHPKCTTALQTRKGTSTTPAALRWTARPQGYHFRAHRQCLRGEFARGSSTQVYPIDSERRGDEMSVGMGVVLMRSLLPTEHRKGCQYTLSGLVAMACHPLRLPARPRSRSRSLSARPAPVADVHPENHQVLVADVVKDAPLSNAEPERPLLAARHRAESSWALTARQRVVARPEPPELDANPYLT